MQSQIGRDGAGPRPGATAHHEWRRAALRRQIRHLHQRHPAGWHRAGEPGRLPNFPARDRQREIRRFRKRDQGRAADDERPALEGSDDAQFGNAPSPANQINQVVVPPAPALASEAYGAELVELTGPRSCATWPLADYASHPIAIQAAAELSSMPAYAGPRDAFGNVTPDLLFRGTYPGETAGRCSRSFTLGPPTWGCSRSASSSSPSRPRSIT